MSLSSNYLSEAPFDARTGDHVAGLSLSYPAWGALIEPVTALAHINAGAPDVRVAAISFLCWCFLTPLLIATVRDAVKKRTYPRFMHYGRALLLGTEASLVFVFYVVFVLLVPLPTWYLHDDTSKSDIIGDLHSHTLFSHDGLVTPLQSLGQHKIIGDQVIGFTEHETPPYYNIEKKNVGIIPGIEIGADDGTYLLALGIHPEEYKRPLVHTQQQVEAFIDQIHRLHHGAVFAMSIHLQPKDVQRLVDMGVDGFEIDNGGHISPSPAMKRTLIEAQKRYGIALLADSDWHGWSSLIQEWTVFRNVGDKGASGAAVVDSLRHHGRDNIIPVTAYHRGLVTPVQAIFSPVLQTYRYAQELNPMRLFAWWLWGLIALLVIKWCRSRQVNPAKAMLASSLYFIGLSSLVVCCIQFYMWFPYREVNQFAGKTYMEGFFLSLLPLFAAHFISRGIQTREYGGTFFLSRLFLFRARNAQIIQK
ncbi:MAG TPA: hypothetical protein VJ961_07910 [Mariprofundaceae bacterium]|nr:hypothetical protein [Mariprofundaceae bacterium]